MTPRAIFAQKAPGLIDRLMKEFHFKDFQAAGVVGNLGHECNGFTQLHEIGQHAGQGGYGWAQWTGPRRKSFLSWCRNHNLDWTSDEGNLSYLLYELENDDKTVHAVLKAPTLEGATLAFERNYEKAGVVNMASRNQWSRWAMEAYRGRGLHAAS